MRGLPLLAALVALAALTPLAAAQGAAPPARQHAPLALGAGGGEAAVAFPFELPAEGSVYAKVLPTPWNPVLPAGQPNGSVAADRTAGLRGWWVQLSIATAAGEVVDLGHYADDGPSAAIPLPAAATHALVARIHAPARAGGLGQEHRVDLALAHRAVEGGAVDATWGMAALLTVSQAAPAPLALDLTWPLLAAAGFVVGGAAVVAARRLRARRADPWFSRGTFE